MCQCDRQHIPLEGSDESSASFTALQVGIMAYAMLGTAFSTEKHRTLRLVLIVLATPCSAVCINTLRP